jgi:DNA-binding response OmpR family regulator
MATLKHILLVDDDNDLRQALAEQLRLTEEFTTTEAKTGREAVETAKRLDDLDLVLLDVGLPDLDGREVCKMLRRVDIKVPVIMLTAANSDSDQVLGLDAGANDYVSKPVKFGVLLARIRAHLRQHQQSEDAVFSIGPYNFRPAHKMLVQKSNERKIRLTEKETAILKFLLRAGTEPVPRDVLLNDVWGYHADVTTHTLETHIYRLRQKIEEDPTNARLLVTEGGGYRLMP